MAQLYNKRILAVNASKTLSSQTSYTGIDIQTFRIEKSARLVFHLVITALTGSLTFQLNTTSDINQESSEVINESFNAPGRYSIPATDVQRYNNTTITATNATYTLGIVLAENSDGPATIAAADSVASIDDKTPPLGQATMANSSPVVIASNQSPVPISGSVSVIDPAEGNTGDPVPAQAIQIGGSDGTNLQAVKVSATGVVSIDGSAVTQPISAVSLPLPTGAATAAGQTQPGVDIGDVTVNNGSGGAAVNIQDGGNSITIDAASLPLPAGAATETTLSEVSGKLPATLGQKTSANSLAVVIASDQSPVPASQSGTWNVNNVSGTVSLPTGASTSALQTDGNASLSSIDSKLTKASTATITTVVRSNVSQTVLSANSNRKGLLLHNDTAAICFVAFAATATTSLFTIRIPTNTLYEMAGPIYTGVISVIWGANGGSNLIVTELS